MEDFEETPTAQQPASNSLMNAGINDDVSEAAAFQFFSRDVGGLVKNLHFPRFFFHRRTVEHCVNKKRR